MTSYVQKDHVEKEKERERKKELMSVCLCVLLLSLVLKEFSTLSEQVGAVQE